MTGVLAVRRSGMVTRRWAVAKIRVLPPGVVPMSKEDEQQAIHAISAMLTQCSATYGPHIA
jgi:hypothetical protein